MFGSRKLSKWITSPSAYVLILTVLFVVAPSAARAQVQVEDGCMEDLYNQFGQGGGLNCTANDIQIASVTNVVITDDGCAFPGDTVTFDATLEVNLTTAQDRHDIGIYLAKDGGDALNGQCVITSLPHMPNNEDCDGATDPWDCCTGAGTGTCKFVDLDGTGDDTNGSDDFGYCSPDGGASWSVPIVSCRDTADCTGTDTCEEFGPGIQDTCGDTDTARNPIFHDIQDITVLCVDTDEPADGSVDIGWCASWRQPGSNDLCLSPLAAFPGAPSKCLCGRADLGVPIVPTTTTTVPPTTTTTTTQPTTTTTTVPPTTTTTTQVTTTTVPPTTTTTTTQPTTTTTTVPPTTTTTTVSPTTTSTSTATTSSSTTTTLPDHYKCYKTRQRGSKFTRRDVTLDDQFSTTHTTVLKPRHFCNPVDKNGEGIGDPTAHMICYKIREPKFQKQEVVVENQFGQQTLTVLRPYSLCVPAEKDGVPSDLNINHVKCYRVAQGRPKFAEVQVDLEDQFETKTTTVRRPRMLCTPVDKNGEGIVAPDNHMTCYSIRDAAGQPKFQPRSVDVMDQFAEQDLNTLRGDCRKGSYLCVPSTKRIPSPSRAFLNMGTSILD